MEYFDEGSSEGFESGERHHTVYDEEEGYLSDDVSDTFAQLHFSTATYHNQDNFTSLPPFVRKKEDMEIKDVVKDNVLRYLPAKSLMRFRSVSKEWDYWIRRPLLAHHQSYCFRDISGFFSQRSDRNPTFITLNRAAYGVPTPSLGFLPEAVDIRSSSNGLILCQGCNGCDSYYICNPANQEWEELPKPTYYHGSEPAVVLVFEPSALNMGAHYHLICAVPLPDLPIVRFEMYSSKMRSWRILDQNCVELEYSSFTGNGFYMKETAYWETSMRKILALDLKSKEYDIIPLPSESPPGGVLARIQEELSYVGIRSYSGNQCSIEIYRGIQLNIRQRIDIHLEEVPGDIHGYRILPCVHGDVVMILAGSFIYSYRLSDQRIEVISREGVDLLATNKILPYVNSLVSVA
ncbi:hypothetical protein CDL12_10725 [Handroanthus impetiginosus]|uniref:Uncharacterized protein n=1 Tax=Handroanthus impetiginosus TaxID=429701 RepID=A0A2G9HGI2_9LAMI|nr:hypothetical protein CDL12_10725 [Handroanthus impetiginosus]